jgi:hypothetical protein
MTRRFRLLSASSIIAIALAIFAAGSEAFCQATQRDIDAFAKASLVYIATVRKDGNQSKAAPIWFTTTTDHVLIINTGPNTWKAKRIGRGSSAVLVWIGSEDGPAFIGKAEITKDQALQTRIITDYPQKYLTARVGLFKPTQEKYDSGKNIVIKITPVRDLPEHFTSKPGTPPPSLEPAASASAAPH